MARVKYVFVPAPTDEEIRELELLVPEGQEVECLMEEIKRQLRMRNPGGSARQREAKKKALMQNVPKGTSVSPDLLNAAGSLDLVESVPLLLHSRDNDHVGVNLYVDDAGALKQLPLNRRASDLCMTCGRPTEVYGDAWLARVFDDDNDFRRLDFPLTDMSSTAAWVVQARKQAAARAQGESAAATVQRMTAQAAGAGAAAGTAARRGVQIEEISPAVQAKEAGNKAFKATRFADAAADYTRALELDSGMLAARNNRALAYLRLDRPRDALADCDAVLACSPEDVKALLRKGDACLALQDSAGAAAAWRAALAVQPQNSQAQAALARMDAGAASPEQTTGASDNS